MATVTFRCPSCQATGRAALKPQEIRCSACSASIRQPIGETASSPNDCIERCIICGSQELFIRKDFPQRLGVAIVVSGFAISCITWHYQWVVATFGILFGTAAIDVMLYFLMGNVLECYQCHSQYRGIPRLDGHEAFDLEVHERHRQRAARLKSVVDSTHQS